MIITTIIVFAIFSLVMAGSVFRYDFVRKGDKILWLSILYMFIMWLGYFLPTLI